MYLITTSFLTILFIFSPLSTSIPTSSHPYHRPSQISLDRFLALTPLIVGDPLPADVLAELAEQAKNNALSESLPNPIAEQYPTQISGTINASYFVIPISYEVARAAVPAKYPILGEQIRKVWRGGGRDEYPLILSVQLDHDIQAFGAGIPDFNILAFRFPFIDLLNDGHTPFTYLPSDFLSNTTLGIQAGGVYGIDVIVSTFTPVRDPYAFVPGAKNKGPRFVKAKPAARGTGKGFEAKFEDKGKLNRKGFDFWQTILNQPFFANPAPPGFVTCGVQYKFYDTVVTTGKYAPVKIKGPASLEGGVVKELPDGFNEKKAKGTRFDLAFLEKNYLNCSELA